MSLGSNGVDRVRSLRKIPKWLRDTNFCTSLARFASSFVRQPNSPKCTKKVQFVRKQKFRVQRGGSGAFVAKNSNAIRGTNFRTSSAHFPSSVGSQPNGPNYTKILRNTQKYEFWVQWGGSGAFVAKNWRDFVSRTFPPVWPFLD